MCIIQWLDLEEDFVLWRFHVRTTKILHRNGCDSRQGKGEEVEVFRKGLEVCDRGGRVGFHEEEALEVSRHVAVRDESSLTQELPLRP